MVERGASIPIDPMSAGLRNNDKEKHHNMQTNRIAIAVLFCVGAALAQDSENGMTNDDRFRVPEALQQTLGLTEVQIEQLRDNNRSMVEEVRPLARQLARKQRDLRRETRSETPNETIIGTITLEISEINGAIDAIRARYQASARTILNPFQLEALKPIESAAARVYQVRQAAQFNLVMLPERDEPDDPQGPGRQQPRGRR